MGRMARREMIGISLLNVLGDVIWMNLAKVHKLRTSHRKHAASTSVV